jgi:hypothetical protein
MRAKRGWVEDETPSHVLFAETPVFPATPSYPHHTRSTDPRSVSRCVERRTHQERKGPDRGTKEWDSTIGLPITSTQEPINSGESCKPHSYGGNVTSSTVKRHVYNAPASASASNRKPSNATILTKTSRVSTASPCYIPDVRVHSLLIGPDTSRSSSKALLSLGAHEQCREAPTCSVLLEQHSDDGMYAHLITVQWTRLMYLVLQPKFRVHTNTHNNAGFQDEGGEGRRSSPCWASASPDGRCT